MLLWQLFLTFFRIGLFAIGGAYSFLPLLQKETVERYQWLTKEEFLDVLGMVKIFPGAISIKFATYTGYKLSGMAGAVVANLGNLLAPFVLTLALTWFYSRYKDTAAVKHAFAMIQLVIFAMILAVAFQMINVKQLTNFKNILVIISALGIFLFSKIDPAVIIILAGILGFFVH